MSVVGDWAGPIIGLTIVAVLMYLAMRRRSRIVDRLMAFATATGLQDPKVRSYGVSATWNGLPVRFQWIAGRRGVPTRVLVTVRGASPGRMIVRSSDPMMDRLFGPPLVKNLQTQFRFVRADDSLLAERLLRDAKVDQALVSNIHGDHEYLRLDRKGLRVMLNVREVESVDEVMANGWPLIEALTRAVPLQR